jgi:hypothetical protein
MSKRHRFLYLSENGDIAVGDSPKPKGQDFKSGGARTIIDTIHDRVWTGSEWEDLEVDNVSESSD